MMRLFLDYQEGATLIPCPTCNRPLLLGLLRQGRWYVGYRGGLPVRPGSRRAHLLCSGYTCDYREQVEIAATPDDAIIFSPSRAAHLYQRESGVYDSTLDEARAEVHRVIQLYRETGDTKLLCAMHSWREHYSYQYWDIKEQLESAHEQGKTVACYGKDEYCERGRVQMILHDAVLLERTDTDETVLVRAGDLRLVCGVLPETEKARFDFGPFGRLPTGHQTIDIGMRHVEIGGRRLSLEQCTDFGLVRVSTHDPETAQALDLRQMGESYWFGEFPAALVERYYRLIRFAQVQGHRLQVKRLSTHPDYLVLETRDMAVAQELRLHRGSWRMIGPRRALRWSRLFHRAELDRLEELQIPLQLTWGRPAGRRRRR